MTRTGEAAVIQIIEIPGWKPTPLNKLLGGHWGKAATLKKKDREMVGTAWLAHGCKKATGRRAVHLLIVLGPSERAADPDAYWKSTLDALVACGALVDDNRQNVHLVPPRFARGDWSSTFITLEDLE